MPMTEDRVREIHKATDLSQYSHEELREADLWVRDYALARLAEYVGRCNTKSVLASYVFLMARCHYGSIETDQMLTVCGCYPEWMRETS